MLFNSYIFVFLFLPVTLLLYYGLNIFNKDKAAKVALVTMSLWFYAYFRLSYIFVILSSIVINYTISFLTRKCSGKKKIILTIGITMDVLLIFYFKYLDFTITNLNLIFHADIPLQHILLPLGISFFTFQQIGYLVDSYNEVIEDKGFLDYILFITFFPQLIAGPIVSYNEMVGQFNDAANKKWNSENFSLGLFWFACGLGKKVLIADTLGVGSSWGYANTAILTGPEAILTGLLYTLQLYFDFSGYCDMACGIAKMFGFDLPINFLSPLKALSIMEFWNKWHITLGRFLAAYLFNPMVTACNRRFLSDKSMDKEKKKKLKNRLGLLCLFMTFFISGIWHGAWWTFILWGCLQGIGRVLYQIFKKKYDGLSKVIRWPVNFVFNVFSMALFGAPTVTAFGQMLSRIPTGWSKGLNPDFLECFNVLEFKYIEEHVAVLGRLALAAPWIHITIVVLTALGIALFANNIYEMKNRRNIVTAIGSSLILIWSVMSLSRMATFLYFNF